MSSKYTHLPSKYSFSGKHAVKRYKGNTKELASIPAYTLHKPIQKKYPRRKVLIFKPKSQYIADLIDVQSYSKENDGIKYLLTCIDGFSRVADVVPIKNKTGVFVANALKSIFQKRSFPRFFQTDQGTEFFNKDVKKMMNEFGTITHFHTNSELKAVIVERFNQTLMRRLTRYMTHYKTRRYLDALQPIVDNYNDTWHSSIKMTPNQVSDKNYKQVFNTLHPDYSIVKNTKPAKFKVGDKVLISRIKATFEKGYAQNWKNEIFIITNVYPTIPTTYNIKDLKGENIYGIFYDQELQKVDHD